MNRASFDDPPNPPEDFLFSQQPGPLTPHPEATISPHTDLTADWERALAYQHSGAPLEVQIVDFNRGGLIAAFGRLRGFVPNSHLPAIRGNPNTPANLERKQRMIGSELMVVVLEAIPENNRLIFSARLGDQAPAPSDRLDELQVGQVVTGHVVNLTPFGAFVDIGYGVNGLIHVSELSWKHIQHPREVVQKGDEITAQVQRIDRQRRRFSMSAKALQPNPWENIGNRYHVGDLVEGVITAQRRFGYFVRLAAGVEALLHNSEIPHRGGFLPEGELTPGRKILARIVLVEPEKRRISLSLQQVTLEDQLSWLLHQQLQEETNSPSPRP